MKKKYTFTDLCVEILSQSGTPMSPDEIWKKALEEGWDMKIGTVGKTPFATIGARIYTDIKENGENSVFIQVSKRPARFVLRNSNIKEKEIESAIEKKQKQEEKSDYKFHERDLHPLWRNMFIRISILNVLSRRYFMRNRLKKAKALMNGCTPI